ncbi:hypothetical protein RCL1_000281 [Eukaryota sp. TZLM3-RCL]
MSLPNVRCSTYVLSNSCAEVEKTCHHLHSEYDMFIEEEHPSSKCHELFQLAVTLFRLYARGHDLIFTHVADLVAICSTYLSLNLTASSIEPLLPVFFDFGAARLNSQRKLCFNFKSLINLTCTLRPNIKELSQLPVLASDLPHASFIEFEQVHELNFYEDASIPFHPGFSVCLVLHFQDRCNIVNVGSIPSNRRPSILVFRDVTSNEVIGLYQLPKIEDNWRPLPTLQILTNKVLKPGTQVSVEALSSDRFSMNGLCSTVSLLDYTHGQYNFVNVLVSPLPLSFASSLSAIQRPVFQLSRKALTIEVDGSNLTSCYVVLTCDMGDILVAPLRLSLLSKGYEAKWTQYVERSKLLPGCRWPFFRSKKSSFSSKSDFFDSLYVSEDVLNFNSFKCSLLGLVDGDLLVLPSTLTVSIDFVNEEGYFPDVFKGSEVVLPFVTPKHPLISISAVPTSLVYNCSMISVPFPNIPPPPFFKFKAKPVKKQVLSIESAANVPPRGTNRFSSMCLPRVAYVCSPDSASDDEYDSLLNKAGSRFLESPRSSISPLCFAAQLSQFPLRSHLLSKPEPLDKPVSRLRSLSNVSSSALGIDRYSPDDDADLDELSCYFSNGGLFQ